MDDRFLNQLRREPDPRFAAELRERLIETEARRRAWPWPTMLAAAAAVAVVAALCFFPSVRASAQSMLDLFRVRNFAAVKFDETRVEKLRAATKDGNPLLLIGTARVLEEPGKPQVVASPSAAGAIAGFDVHTPGNLPSGLALSRVRVEGAAAGSFTADAGKLRSVLEEFDIHDLDVPPGVDGKTITVRKPPVVIQDFASDRHQAHLLEARSPQVELPAGLDLARLAEIGMRILGVERNEARRLASSVDWHSTLLVPVPSDASSFRSVEVNGNPGMLVTSSGHLHSHEGAPDAKSSSEPGSVVMWSESDRVYALVGNLNDVDLLQMAESTR